MARGRCVAPPDDPDDLSDRRGPREPARLNSNLGVYTTFGNLMDLAASPFPRGFARRSPSGVQLVGPRASDADPRRGRPRVSPQGRRLPGSDRPSAPAVGRDGPGHLADADPCAPRNRRRRRSPGRPTPQPSARRPRRDPRARRTTAPRYRLYALRGTVPPKPGLVRVRKGGSPSKWRSGRSRPGPSGRSWARIPRPLCVGSIELDDGTYAQGFLCENDVLADAIDISDHGGWRAYLRARATASG